MGWGVSEPTWEAWLHKDVPWIGWGAGGIFGVLMACLAAGLATHCCPRRSPLENVLPICIPLLGLAIGGGGLAFGAGWPVVGITFGLPVLAFLAVGTCQLFSKRPKPSGESPQRQESWWPENSLRSQQMEFDSEFDVDENVVGSSRELSEKSTDGV